MEYHRGRFIEVEKLPEESLEDLCKKICKENNITMCWDIEDCSSYLTYTEALLDVRYKEYFVVKERLFKILEDYRIEEDAFTVTRLDNGEYSFSGGFYNGGACLHEILEDGVINILESDN